MLENKELRNNISLNEKLINNYQLTDSINNYKVSLLNAYAKDAANKIAEQEKVINKYRYNYIYGGIIGIVLTSLIFLIAR